MPHCRMCGMDVPAGKEGRCFVGHRLPETVAAGVRAAGQTAAAITGPPPPAVEESPLLEPLVEPAHIPPPPAGEAPPPLVLDPMAAALAHGVASETVPQSYENASPPPPPPPPPGPAAELLPPTSSVRTGRSGRGMLAGLLAFVLAVAGAGTYFVFGSGGSAEAAHYRRTFEPGERHVYEMTMHMKGTAGAAGFSQPLDLRMTMQVSEEVLAVDESGTATVRHTADGIDVSMDGAPLVAPMPQRLEITVRVHPDGRVEPVEGENPFGYSDFGPGADLLGSDQMGPILPHSKVAPGDEWTETIEQPSPFGGDKLRIVSRNKLLEHKTVNGEDAAVIRSEIEMPFDVSMTSADMARLAEEQGGPAAPLPSDASMAMHGEINMTLLQTIVAGTGRPIQVTGDGAMRLSGELRGGGMELPALNLDVAFDVDFTEIQGSEAGTGVPDMSRAVQA